MLLARLSGSGGRAAAGKCGLVGSCSGGPKLGVGASSEKVAWGAVFGQPEADERAVKS
jgi:hypothetical protein